MNNQLNIVPHVETPLFDLESLAGNHEACLSKLSGMKVFFRSDFGKEAIPLQNLETVPSECPYQIRSFSPESKERLVTAIDSSCVLIGETEQGAIFAARVAVVSAQESKNREILSRGALHLLHDHELSGRASEKRTSPKGC